MKYTYIYISPYISIHKYIYIYTYIFIYIIMIIIFSNTDFPDPLLPPVSIVYRSRQVLQVTSCIGTEQLCIGSRCFACPYEGVNRSTSLMSSSLLYIYITIQNFYINIYIHVCMHIHIHADVCIYIYIYIYIYIGCEIKILNDFKTFFLLW